MKCILQEDEWHYPHFMEVETDFSVEFKEYQTTQSLSLRLLFYRGGDIAQRCSISYPRSHSKFMAKK